MLYVSINREQVLCSRDNSEGNQKEQVLRINQTHFLVLTDARGSGCLCSGPAIRWHLSATIIHKTKNLVFLFVKYVIQIFFLCFPFSSETRSSYVPLLTENSLWSPGWPQTCSNLPASVSLLGLLVHATISSTPGHHTLCNAKCTLATLISHTLLYIFKRIPGSLILNSFDGNHLCFGQLPLKCSSEYAP